LVVKKYNESTTGKVGEYYARNAAFVAGETDSLTFNLAVEVLNTYIKVYVDGELYIEYTNATGLGMFDDDATCIGVGFTSATTGTKFANYTFTAMEAEEVKPTETNKNGYLISADGKTYTSTELRAATTVDGMGARYGKWSADVTITETGNSRVGLYINAYVPTSEGLVRYDNKGVKCYYLHHSASANVNFTLTTINNGVYQGRPVFVIRPGELPNVRPEKLFNMLNGNGTFADKLAGVIDWESRAEWLAYFTEEEKRAAVAIEKHLQTLAPAV
jgi:hypothetical protein